MSKRCFSHHNEPNTAMLSFSAVLKYFLQKLTKHLSFLSKYCFSQLIETYTGFFLIKISKIQLIEACLLYRNIFTEIDKNMSFLSKNIFLKTLSHIPVFFY